MSSLAWATEPPSPCVQQNEEAADNCKVKAMDTEEAEKNGAIPHHAALGVIKEKILLTVSGEGKKCKAKPCNHASCSVANYTLD